MRYSGICSPFETTSLNDRYEDGVLSTWGCFQRHQTTREEQLQDSFVHQPLVDNIEDFYTTFKRINKYYAKKQIFIM